MYQDNTAELLNTAAKTLDDGIYIKWNGDDEAPAFIVYFEEEKTPYTIHDVGREFEIWHSVPGSRHYTSEGYSAHADDIAAQLVDLLREEA